MACVLPAIDQADRQSAQGRPLPQIPISTIGIFHFVASPAALKLAWFAMRATAKSLKREVRCSGGPIAVSGNGLHLVSAAAERYAGPGSSSNNRRTNVQDCKPLYRPEVIGHSDP
jgi:hypothetical protein